MPSPENAELVAYLDQLTEATRSGSIEWVEVNPTTYIWETTAPRPARLSLQRVDRMVSLRVGAQQKVTKVGSYVFQAFDMQPGQQALKLTINSAEEKEFNERLETLYEVIKSVMSRRRLDFLQSILPPKREG